MKFSRTNTITRSNTVRPLQCWKSGQKTTFYHLPLEVISLIFSFALLDPIANYNLPRVSRAWKDITDQARKSLWLSEKKKFFRDPIVAIYLKNCSGFQDLFHKITADLKLSRKETQGLSKNGAAYYLRLSSHSSLISLRLIWPHIRKSLEGVIPLPRSHAKSSAIAEWLKDPLHEDPLNNVKSLDLSCLPVCHLPEELKKLTKITNLKADNANIALIATGLFQSMPRLQVLSIKNNNLSSIEKDLFANPELQGLYLQDNKISHIESGSFIGLPNLLELNLDQNPIESLSKEAFKGLFNLVSLSFRDTLLKDMDPDLLSPLKKLKELRCQNIPMGAPSLKTLAPLSLLQDLYVTKEKMNSKQQEELRAFCVQRAITLHLK